MLIFNCSKAFAEFIEPKQSGPVLMVGAPPSPSPAEDGLFLIDADGEPPRHVQQWQVHLVKVRRKPCVLAMEVNTRYAMVFTNVGPGNAPSFLNTFAERLVNEMVFAAQGVGMMADFETMWAQFLERHSRFQFVLRSDRSTQAHLKDAVWTFEDDCEMKDRLPESHEECGLVDATINQTLRTVKGRKDYFRPGTEMLCEWLSAFGGLTAEGIATVRARLLDKMRQAYAAPLPSTESLNS